MRDEVNKEIIYNKCDSYEEYVKNLNYKGPVNLANKLNNYINIAKITNPNILDFGCGTGLLGKEISLILSNNNIFTLDGIDISDEMINICKSKNIYKNVWKKNLFTEKLSKVNHYDIIVSCGVFLEGHVSFKMIDILLNYTRKSGILLFTLEKVLKKNRRIYPM